MECIYVDELSFVDSATNIQLRAEADAETHSEPTIALAVNQGVKPREKRRDAIRRHVSEYFLNLCRSFFSPFAYICLKLTLI